MSTPQEEFLYRDTSRIQAGEYHHLDLGYAFTTRNADVGQVQGSEVTGAGWYPLSEAARLVGHRIHRAAVLPGPAAGGEVR
ncbi:hypothetical protein [Streptomyces lasalocidi]|uniref:hypothetical protein n=1 Tax=Streptomyces lasalocidi TaxID=324833 RepID=UPI0019D6A813|nr:hypothetical protein [Streptomyces lasalocidi]